MSSIVTTPITATAKDIHVSKPSFFGIVNGELFKVRRMWVFWISLVVLFGAICFPNLITIALPTQATELKNHALHFFYNSLEINFFVLRVFIGFVLTILTANVFGREYQLGTIRILLGRGVGRLQLLFAKLLAVVFLAVIILAACLVLIAVLEFLQMFIMAGNTDGLQKLDTAFWNNAWLYFLTILISMGVTILLTLAITAIGRSLAFGLSVSLVFFPIDNIGTVFMILGYRLTHNDFWNNVTAYFLGPNLNAMPSAIVPEHFSNPSAAPLVPVDGTHTLLVALVYAAVFAIVAIVLTWKRDVKE